MNEKINEAGRAALTSIRQMINEEMATTTAGIPSRRSWMDHWSQEPPHCPV